GVVGRAGLSCRAWTFSPRPNGRNVSTVAEAIPAIVASEAGRRRASEKRDERATPHSNISSARPDRGSGTVMPSALAVLRLMRLGLEVLARGYRQPTGPHAIGPEPER